MIFKSNTSPKNPKQIFLSIINSYDSHTITNFIVHCMKHAINFLIVSSQASHILNVGVFAPFKRTLAEIIITIFKLDSGRDLQVN